jgi:hypothetical protein
MYLTFSHTVCVGVLYLNNWLTRLGVRSVLENTSEVKAAITKALAIEQPHLEKEMKNSENEIQTTLDVWRMQKR